jgi:hypothetical protein
MSRSEQQRFKFAISEYQTENPGQPDIITVTEYNDFWEWLGAKLQVYNEHIMFSSWVIE